MIAQLHGMSKTLKILLSSSSLNALVPSLLAGSTGFESENLKIILALKLISSLSQHSEIAEVPTPREGG